MKLKEINLMNTFLCFCVVTIHLTSAPVMSLRHDSIWYLLMFVLNKFLSFSVPAFIFLSGLKLHYQYKNEPINFKSFYIKRFKKIILPYCISYFIYFLFYLYCGLTNLNEFIPSLLLGTLVAHFYYIIIAIQFYLLFPFLNLFFQKFSKALLVISFASTLAFHQFFLFPYSDRFCGTYAFYFILGMFFAKHLNKTKTYKTLMVELLCFICLGIAHISLSYVASLGSFHYTISGIMQILYVTLAIFFIYHICFKINHPMIEKLVHLVNAHTFYIFLYHILIINILQFTIYPNFNLSVKWQFIITSFVVYSTIIGYCYIKEAID